MSLFFVILFVLFSSGFLSLAEASVVSMNKMKAYSLFNSRKDKKSEALFKIIENKDKYLSAIIILNTIVNVVGSIFIGILATKTFNNSFYETLITVLFTGLILYGAEMIPKLYASNNYVKVGLFVSRTLILLSIFIKPMLFFSSFICKPFVKGDSNTMEGIDFKNVIKAANNYGLITELETGIISNSFELSNKKAKYIMTSYSAIETIFYDTSVYFNKEKIINSEHSRLIVVNESGEHIGVVSKDELLVEIANNKKETTVKDLMNPIYIDYLESSLLKILSDIDSSEDHIVLIKDELDNAVGVLTIDDIYRSITLGLKK